MTPSRASGFRHQRKTLSLPLIAAICVLHIAVLYGLARFLAPDFTASVERSMVSVFDVTAAPEPAPPADPDAAEQGAEGDPGADAVPQPVAAPPPRIIERTPAPLPPVASTGTVNRAGAAETGDGTGAAGTGDGLGSGSTGSGRGGGIIGKPVHISGAINNARDYPVPSGGRDARRGNEVIVRVIVGVDGKARDCSIHRASPDPEADRRTCELVVARLGFRPATDARGNAVAAPFFWRQRWF
jgi:periplasmic protein TonB